MLSYNPARFQMTDRKRIAALIDAYPLATMISVVDGLRVNGSSTSQSAQAAHAAPMVSHAPLVYVRNENEAAAGGQLIGHFARANPHWKHLQNGKVTAIFHGPSAYITPQWYVKNDVPTWNFATVHVEGRARLIESEEGLIDCLKLLTAKAEEGAKNPWEFWIPEDLEGAKRLLGAIVGFSIEIESIEAKFKFVQSKSPEDRAKVRQGLREERGDTVSRALADLMENLET